MKHLNISLVHLRNFIVVARLGSFNRAAQELSRTQPAVTSSIKQLEEYLGLKLFERTTRRVTPTTEAQNFLPTAQRLVREFDQAMQDMAATAECRSGHVSLVVLPSVANQLLPGIVQSFVETYPNISIQLSDNNARAVQHSVENNLVDFGVASLWSQDNRLSFEPLFRDTFKLVCHRSHSLAQGQGPLPWKQVAGNSFLGSGLTQALQMQKYIGTPRFECSTTTSLFAMLKANIGVTVLPELAIPQDSELVSRPLVRPIEYREIGLIRRAKSTLSPAANAMLETIRQETPALLAKLKIQ